VQIKKFDSINVVPFIDIMLVLLVIVLTTASFVAKGIIPIDLSEGKSSDTLTLKKELIISIKKDGTLFLDKQIITNSMLEEKLLLHVKETPILINCDKNSKFELFMQVIDLLKKHDYKNLAVITKK
jgi:biopolymer transport protein ExbD